MTLSAVFPVDLFGVNSPVKNIGPEFGNSVTRVFFVSRLGFDEVVLDEFAQTVAGVSAGQVGVIGDVASAEGEAFVQHAKDGHIGRFHPLHLAMHKRPVKCEGLYMAGLYSASHTIALHRLRYRELDISSWGMDMQVDHASGSQHRVHNEKTPGLPSQREPGAWSLVRMYTNDLNRLKTGGTVVVQTPSRASAPDQLGTLVGADTLGVTATDQSTRSAGGGRRVGI